MFHVELFTSSIASGANTFAQVNYNAVDNILPKLVNGLQVSPDIPYLYFIAGVSANLVHLRAQSNSMLPFPYISASPNNRGSAFESPPRFWDFTKFPIPLKPTEEFDVFATQNAGVAQSPLVLAGFADGPPGPTPIPINPKAITMNPATPGRFFTVHSSTTTTQTANAWSLIQLAFDQPLFAGYYALMGARCFAATGLFFRMFPAMGPKWRPGGIAVQAYDSLDPQGQRFWPAYLNRVDHWGPWLYFYQNVPPQVEVYSTAADTAQEVWLDLIYLGPQVIQSTI